MHVEHTARFTRRFHEVTDGVWCLVGNGLSNQTFIEGPAGLICIDTGESIEEMRADPKVYLDSRSFGIIACGFGYQGPGPVLSQLRQTAHALRAWPTPLGVGVNSALDDTQVTLPGSVRNDPSGASTFTCTAAPSFTNPSCRSAT